jgi:hypothetical protein
MAWEDRNMAEWQPIETAPKDGTRVILSWGGKSINGFYLDNSRTATPWAGWRVESMVVEPPGKPTHWQPFPPAYGVAAVPAPKREQREVPPGKWKVDMHDGAYGRMPGDPPGPASVRAVIGGYVYDVAPRTGKLQASEVPRGVLEDQHG